VPFLELPGGERVFYARHRPRKAETQSPAVVCVHGAGGSRLNWPREIRRLPGAETIVLDLPGHGRSSGAGCRTVEGYTAVLVATFKALNLSRAIVLGHSMGGAVALQMALSHPARVQGLVLIGTGARLRVAPALLEELLEAPEQAIALIVEWAFGPDAPAELKRAGQEVMAQTPPQVLHGDFVACDAFDVAGRLGDIAAPTLVIAGTADRLTPLKYAEFLAREIPGAELHPVEKAGHMTMLERPRTVGEAVARFVAAL
jgi:pimeloyl-ACP methyl ester carboxylesterase